MIKVNTDKRVDKVLDDFPETERPKISQTIEFFQEKGFLLDQKYLKKLTKKIWELRPGRIRLLFGMVDNEAIIVNVFLKKTNKTPLKEIKLAEKRLSQYEE